MKTMVLSLLVPVLFWFPAQSQAKTLSCKQIRAAFDIGSGATKLKVASVDTCRNRLLKILFPSNAHEEGLAVRSIGYKKDLSDSYKVPGRTKGHLSKAILKQGSQALKSMRHMVLQRWPTAQFAGVATSAFRQAKNGQAAVTFLSRAAGVKVSIISQQQEAFLGYRAVQARSGGQQNSSMMVWDIGGSSMQMVYRNKKGKLAYYLGHLASVPMSVIIREKFQGVSRAKKKSVNPIQEDDSCRGVTYTWDRAARELKKSAPLILDKARTWKVVGIGGVHSFSIRGQAAPGQDSYTRKDVEWALQQREGLDDAQVARLNRPLEPHKAMRFIGTEVSNLVLILGFMKAMKIHKVHILRANLGDGLFISSEYW